MTDPSNRKTRRNRTNRRPLGKLDLRIELTQEEILADLMYPARTRRIRRSA